MNLEYRQIKKDDDIKLASIIRENLKAFKLDIPGTAYFDDNLNHLSDYYLADALNRAYYVVVDDAGEVLGGVGLARLDFMKDTGELQKLYLKDSVKRNGISYDLMELIESEAKKRGYKRIYLETHTNLTAAIHLYEKTGYKQIDKPVEVVHSAMNRFYLKDLAI